MRTLDAGAAFLCGKPPMPIDDAMKNTRLYIGRLSKSEEKIKISQKKQRIDGWKRRD